MESYKSRIITILVHVAVWLSLYFYPFVSHYTQFNDLRAYLRIAFSLGLLMLLFYSNTFLLIPRLLRARRFFIYALFILIFIVGNAFANRYIQVLLNPAIVQKPELYNDALEFGLFASIAAWVVSSGSKITTEWFRSEQQRKNIEHEKLRAELTFLKMQVNPHFLFNTLNNIYALENKKSPRTGDAILKLSEIIRYMLYDTSSDKVELEKEIEYINKYIELQKLSIEEGVKISFTVNGNIEHKKIEPMLLIPLIENAFKHGINYRNKTPIDIYLNIEGNQLLLKVENQYAENKKADNGNSGIGLNNLQKRLTALYPTLYELTLLKDNGKYIATLKIKLYND